MSGRDKSSHSTKPSGSRKKDQPHKSKDTKDPQAVSKHHRKSRQAAHLDSSEKHVKHKKKTEETAKTKAVHHSGDIVKAKISNKVQTGTQSDLYVSVRLASTPKSATGGFKVEGLVPVDDGGSKDALKKKVHFGKVYKRYIERRKKVRFSKTVATYKWPMSRRVKFVKLKKPAKMKRSKKVKGAERLRTNRKTELPKEPAQGSSKSGENSRAKKESANNSNDQSSKPKASKSSSISSDSEQIKSTKEKKLDKLTPPPSIKKVSKSEKLDNQGSGISGKHNVASVAGPSTSKTEAPVKPKKPPTIEKLKPKQSNKKLSSTNKPAVKIAAKENTSAVKDSVCSETSKTKSKSKTQSTGKPVKTPIISSAAQPSTKSNKPLQSSKVKQVEVKESKGKSKSKSKKDDQISSSKKKKSDSATKHKVCDESNSPGASNKRVVTDPKSPQKKKNRSTRLDLKLFSALNARKIRFAIQNQRIMKQRYKLRINRLRRIIKIDRTLKKLAHLKSKSRNPELCAKLKREIALVDRVKRHLTRSIGIRTQKSKSSVANSKRKIGNKQQSSKNHNKKHGTHAKKKDLSPSKDPKKQQNSKKQKRPGQTISKEKQNIKKGKLQDKSKTTSKEGKSNSDKGVKTNKHSAQSTTKYNIKQNKSSHESHRSKDKSKHSTEKQNSSSKVGTTNSAGKINSKSKSKSSKKTPVSASETKTHEKKTSGPTRAHKNKTQTSRQKRKREPSRKESHHKRRKLCSQTAKQKIKHVSLKQAGKLKKLPKEKSKFLNKTKRKRSRRFSLKSKLVIDVLFSNRLRNPKKLKNKVKASETKTGQKWVLHKVNQDKLMQAFRKCESARSRRIWRKYSISLLIRLFRLKFHLAKHYKVKRVMGKLYKLKRSLRKLYWLIKKKVIRFNRSRKCSKVKKKTVKSVHAKKRTSFEKRLMRTKAHLYNRNKQIKRLKNVLKQRKKVKRLSRNQLLQFAISKNLRPVYVHGGPPNSQGKCLLLREKYGTSKPLNCAHFRMIHDTQNLFVIKSHWGNTSHTPNTKKEVVRKTTKTPLLLKSRYVKCFSQARKPIITCIPTKKSSALPMHLGTKSNILEHTGTCTVISTIRPNGFGYFYYPNSSSTKILRTTKQSGKLKRLQIRLKSKISNPKKSNVLNTKWSNSLKKPTGKTTSRKIKSKKLNVRLKQLKVKTRELPVSRDKKSNSGLAKTSTNLKKGKGNSRAKSSTGGRSLRAGQRIETSLSKSQCESIPRRYRPTTLNKTAKRKSTSLKKNSRRKKSWIRLRVKSTIRSKFSIQRKKGSIRPSVVLKKVSSIGNTRKKIILKRSHLSRDFILRRKTVHGHKPRLFIKRKSSHRWFVQRKYVAGQKSKFVMVRKRISLPKKQWVVRTRRKRGRKPRLYLSKKYVFNQYPRWILKNKSFVPGKLRLKLRDKPVRSRRYHPTVEKILNRALWGAVKRGRKPRILLSKKRVAGKSRLLIKRNIRRRRVKKNRRKSTSQTRVKSQIIINKRKLPGGKTRLTIIRKSPKRKRRIIKMKLFGPGLIPRVIIDKATGPGGKANIFILTQSIINRQETLRRLKTKFLEQRMRADENDMTIIRKELLPGNKVHFTKHTSSQLSKCIPRLLLQKGIQSPQKSTDIIVRQTSPRNKTTRYMIPKQPLVNKRTNFLLQLGQKPQIMSVKKLEDGKVTQILCRKILRPSKQHVEIKSKKRRTKRNVILKGLKPRTVKTLVMMKKPSCIGEKPKVMIRKYVASPRGNIRLSNFSTGKRSQYLQRKFKTRVLINKCVAPGMPPQITIQRIAPSPRKCHRKMKFSTLQNRRRFRFRPRRRKIKEIGYKTHVVIKKPSTPQLKPTAIIRRVADGTEKAQVRIIRSQTSPSQAQVVVKKSRPPKQRTQILISKPKTPGQKPKVLIRTFINKRKHSGQKILQPILGEKTQIILKKPKSPGGKPKVLIRRLITEVPKGQVIIKNSLAPGVKPKVVFNRPILKGQACKVLVKKSSTPIGPKVIIRRRARLQKRRSKNWRKLPIAMTRKKDGSNQPPLVVIKKPKVKGQRPRVLIRNNVVYKNKPTVILGKSTVPGGKPKVSIKRLSTPAKSKIRIVKSCIPGKKSKIIITKLNASKDKSKMKVRIVSNRKGKSKKLIISRIPKLRTKAARKMPSKAGHVSKRGKKRKLAKKSVRATTKLPAKGLKKRKLGTTTEKPLKDTNNLHSKTGQIFRKGFKIAKSDLSAVKPVQSTTRTITGSKKFKIKPMPSAMHSKNPSVQTSSQKMKATSKPNQKNQTRPPVQTNKQKSETKSQTTRKNETPKSVQAAKLKNEAQSQIKSGMANKKKSLHSIAKSSSNQSADESLPPRPTAKVAENPAKRKFSRVSVSPQEAKQDVNKRRRTENKTDSPKMSEQEVSKSGKETSGAKLTQKTNVKTKRRSMKNCFPHLLASASKTLSERHKKCIEKCKSTEKPKNSVVEDANPSVFKVPEIPPIRKSNSNASSQDTETEPQISTKLMGTMEPMSGASKCEEFSKNASSGNMYGRSVVQESKDADSTITFQRQPSTASPSSTSEPVVSSVPADPPTDAEARSSPAINRDEQTTTGRTGPVVPTSLSINLFQSLAPRRSYSPLRTNPSTFAFNFSNFGSIFGFGGCPYGSPMDADSRQPVPAILAVRKMPRYRRTTVASLLESLARRTARAAQGITDPEPMDAESEFDTPVDSPDPALINEEDTQEAESSKDKTEKDEDVVGKPLLELHPISSILESKRFAPIKTNASNENGNFTPSTMKMPNLRSPMQTRNPSPEGIKITIFATEPMGASPLDEEYEVINPASTIEVAFGKRKLFRPYSSLRFTTKVFNRKPTSARKSKFFMSFAKTTSASESHSSWEFEEDNARFNQFNHPLPIEMCRHKVSDIERRAIKIKKQRIFSVVHFARQRAKKFSRMRLAALRDASGVIKKGKFSSSGRMRSAKNSNLKRKKNDNSKKPRNSKVLRPPSRTVKKGKFSCSGRLGSVKTTSPTVKKQENSEKQKKKKTTGKINKDSTPKKTLKGSKLIPKKSKVLKSILKKQIDTKARLKLKRLKPLSPSFVLKSILKKSKTYSSPSTAEKPGPSKENVSESAKKIKKKIVLDSILSHVPQYRCSKGSGCKHCKSVAKALKACRKSTSSTLKSSSSATSSSRGTKSSSQRKNVPAVFKVPAVPPVSSGQIKKSAPAGVSSAPESSTYIAPKASSSASNDLPSTSSKSSQISSTEPDSKRALLSKSKLKSTKKGNTSESRPKSPSRLPQRKYIEKVDMSKFTDTGKILGKSGLTLSVILGASEMAEKKKSIDSASKTKAPGRTTVTSTKPASSSSSAASKSNIAPGNVETIDLTRRKIVSDSENIETIDLTRRKIVSSDSENIEMIDLTAKRKIVTSDPNVKLVDLTVNNDTQNTKLVDLTSDDSQSSTKPKIPVPTKAQLKQTPCLTPIKTPVEISHNMEASTSSPQINPTSENSGIKEKTTFTRVSNKTPKSMLNSTTNPKTDNQSAAKPTPTSTEKLPKTKRSKTSKSNNPPKSAGKKAKMSNKSRNAKKTKCRKCGHETPLRRKRKANSKKPRLKISYRKKNVNSVTATRLKVMTSVYCSYEKEISGISKPNIKLNTHTATCPNVAKEVYYINKVKRSNLFRRFLGLPRIKRLHRNRKAKNLQVLQKNDIVTKIRRRYAKLRASKKHSKIGIKKSPLKSFYLPSVVKKKSVKSAKKTVTWAPDVKSKKGNIKKKGKSNMKSKSKPPVQKKSGKASNSKQLHAKKKKPVSKSKTHLKRNGKITKKNLVSRPKAPLRKINENPLRIIVGKKKNFVLPNAAEMPLTPIFVPKTVNTIIPCPETIKPCLLATPKQMRVLEKLKRTMDLQEKHGLVKDWSRSMARLCVKPSRKKITMRTEWQLRMPSNRYVLHTIELVQHKRKLEDRMRNLVESGVAMKIGPMPKMPNNARGFLEEDTIPMDQNSVEAIIKQRLCLSIAHAGFTDCEPGVLSTMSLAVQNFYRTFCSDLKETVHRSMNHMHTGFPDPMDRVLTEKGFGGVRGLEEYCNAEILQRHKCFQNGAALKRVEYAAILRTKLGLAPHTQITPGNFSDDENLIYENPPPPPEMTSDNPAFRNVLHNKDILESEKPVLELIYELETDVLKSSPSVLTHEVLRPRFLEYRESVGSPQSQLELTKIPVTARVKKRKLVKRRFPQTTKESETAENNEKVSSPIVDKQKVGTNPTTEKSAEKGTIPSTTSDGQAQKVPSTLKQPPIPLAKVLQQQKLPSPIAHLPSTLQRLLMAGPQRAQTPGQKTPSAIVPPNLAAINPQKLLLAKALALRRQIANASTSQQQANIIRSLTPRMLQLLNLTEVAKKLKERDEALAKMQSGQNLAQSTTATAVNTNSAQTPQPTTSAKSQAFPTTKVNAALVNNGTPGSSSSQYSPHSQTERVFPRDVNPLQKSTPLTGNIPGPSSRVNIAPSQTFGPSTSSTGTFLASKGPNDPIQIRPQGTSTPRKSVVHIPTATTPDSATDAKSVGKPSAGFSPNKNPPSDLKATKQAVLNVKITKRRNVLKRISDFIQKLPERSRLKVLLRNPHLIRALGKHQQLGIPLRKRRRTANIVNSPANPVMVIDSRTGTARSVALRRNQVQVYNNKTKKMEIVTLKRNQYKFINKKKQVQIRTLPKRQQKLKDPITKKSAIVSFDAEQVRITSINKTQMKIILPNSNQEKVVYMSSLQQPKSKWRSSSTKWRANEMRVTDVKGRVFKITTKKQSPSTSGNTVLKVPISKLKAFNPKTKKTRQITLKPNEIAVLDSKTKKIKIKRLQKHQVKFINPKTKKVEIRKLNSNEMKIYNEKTNTFQIVNIKGNDIELLDPKTKQPKTISLKPNEVKVVNPATKKVGIVNIERLQSIHPRSRNIRVLPKFLELKRLNSKKKVTRPSPFILKGSKVIIKSGGDNLKNQNLNSGTFGHFQFSKSKSIPNAAQSTNSSPDIIFDKTVENIDLSKETDSPDPMVVPGPTKTGTESTMDEISDKDSVMLTEANYQTTGMTTTASFTSVGGKTSAETVQSALFYSTHPTEVPNLDRKETFTEAQKNLIKAGPSRSSSFFYHPYTPPNYGHRDPETFPSSSSVGYPNQTQFLSSSNEDVSPKGATMTTKYGLPSTAKVVYSSSADKQERGKSHSTAKTTSTVVNLPSAGLTATEKFLAYQGEKSLSSPASHASKVGPKSSTMYLPQTHSYSGLNITPGGLLSTANKPHVTPGFPITSKSPDTLISGISQPLKVAYRIPQAKLTPVVPHTTATINVTSDGSRKVSSLPSLLSPTKVVYTSSTFQKPPVSTAAASSTTGDSKKGEKSRDKSSHSTTSKSSSRHSDSSSSSKERSSKSSKSSSRSSDSKTSDSKASDSKSSDSKISESKSSDSKSSDSKSSDSKSSRSSDGKHKSSSRSSSKDKYRSSSRSSSKDDYKSSSRSSDSKSSGSSKSSSSSSISHVPKESSTKSHRTTSSEISESKSSSKGHATSHEEKPASKRGRPPKRPAAETPPKDSSSSSRHSSGASSDTPSARKYSKYSHSESAETVEAAQGSSSSKAKLKEALTQRSSARPSSSSDQSHSSSSHIQSSQSHSHHQSSSSSTKSKSSSSSSDHHSKTKR